MEIKSITILTNNKSSDIIFLHVDLPSTMPNIDPSDHVTFTIQAQRGYGKEWCVKNFKDTPINVVNTND
jgi:hypothetical protein